ncbi:MAG: glycosyltransferase family 2 protein [Desulfuromonadales bacterium]|nr:glycosyltransferase family 2 protein [Desulfuromonadales bacterium]
MSSLDAIIVNYHSHQLTAGAVASVLADRPDARVVVVDNSCSTAEFHSLQAVLPPEVECLCPSDNLGFGKACNLAYCRTSADWVLLLNPDALIVPGCLERMIAFLRATPRAGAVAPLAWWDEERQWLLPPAQMPTPFSELTMALAMRFPGFGRVISRRFRRRSLQTLLSPRPVRQCMLSGGNVLLRRSAIERAGGLFDPLFFMYYEDTDLCRRLTAADCDLYLLPTAEVVHKWHVDAAKSALCAASRQHYFHKHFAGNPLACWGERLTRRLSPSPGMPGSLDLGVVAAPPRFNIPDSLAPGWVMEISLHPLLIPASYHLGQGTTCHFPAALWECLGPGHYWARLAGRDQHGELLYHWQVAPS